MEDSSTEPKFLLGVQVLYDNILFRNHHHAFGDPQQRV